MEAEESRPAGDYCPAFFRCSDCVGLGERVAGSFLLNEGWAVWGDTGFQSSLLRCFHCDSQEQQGVSQSLNTFQSSLLRCFHCDFLGRPKPPQSWRSFNPLYWGVFIVTAITVKPTGTSISSFNPLYWGVFIVTSHRLKSLKSHLFSFNPLYWGVFIVTFVMKLIPNVLRVSILFIEVFSLWLPSSFPPDPPCGFQSSLLRCFHCDDPGFKLPVSADTRPGFNPLYWGVFIVTMVIKSCVRVPAKVSILFIEVFSLWQRD